MARNIPMQPGYNPFVPQGPVSPEPMAMMRPVPLRPTGGGFFPPAPGAGAQWRGMDGGYRPPNPFNLGGGRPGRGSGFGNIMQALSPFLIGYGASLSTGSPEFGHRLMNRAFEQGRDRREGMASRDALSRYLVQAERPRLAELARTNPEMAAQFYRGEATGTDSGMAPVHGVDAEGNPVLMQPTRAGEVRRLKMPEGVTLAPGFERVDAGTHWLLVDKKTGRAVDTIPKNLYEKGFETKSGEVAGTAQGEAQVDLGRAISEADHSLQLINEMIAHPGRAAATGKSALLPWNMIPGTDAYNFTVRNRQLEGKAFLQAFESLKGGGHITEIEGQKATDAMARLDRWQSDEEYEQALKDLKEVLEAGKARAREAAAQTPRSLNVGQANPIMNPGSEGGQTDTNVRWRRK